MLGRTLLLGGLALAAFATSASAQPCADPADTFWKNDTLADAPVGQTGATVIVALCLDEAAGTVFRLPPGSAPQYLKQVSFGFGHVTDEDAFLASTNIEIYQGEPGWNPGGPLTSMGPKIFDLQADAGVTFDVDSSGFSSFDLTPYNVVVSDTFVVAIRMLTNSALVFPVCPSATQGTPANFLTDGSGCTPQLNVLDERVTGWVDPTDWQFAVGQTICPNFYNGNWAIRACTTDAGFWTDQGNGLAGATGTPVMQGTGPLTVGSFNPLSLSNTQPSTATFLVIGFSGLFAPLKGGVLVPSPDILIAGIPTDATGGWTIASPWPAGVPSGFEIYWQAWIADGAGPVGFAASNGVSSTSP